MHKQYIDFKHADAILQDGDGAIYFFANWNNDNDVLVIRTRFDGGSIAVYAEKNAMDEYETSVEDDGCQPLDDFDWPFEIETEEDELV